MKEAKKRSWTKDFYEKAVPENLREYICLIDFYKALGFLTTEASKNGYPINPVTTTIRKIYQYRFVADRTVSDILSELKISRKTYNETLNKYAQIINHYMILEVMEYPVRIAILLTRNLKNKSVLCWLYNRVRGDKEVVRVNGRFMIVDRNEPLPKITVQDIVDCYLVEHGCARKSATRLVDIFPPTEYDLTTKEKNQILDLTISLHWLYKQENFIHYVKKYEGNMKRLVYSFDRFEKLLANPKSK